MYKWTASLSRNWINDRPMYEYWHIEWTDAVWEINKWYLLDTFLWIVRNLENGKNRSTKKTIVVTSNDIIFTYELHLYKWMDKSAGAKRIDRKLDIRWTDRHCRLTDRHCLITDWHCRITDKQCRMKNRFL